MDDREYVLDEINLLMIRKQTTEGMQAQKPRNRSISKAHAGRGDLQDKHTQTHFTLCLCGLSEPAKLSFLLLSEVSQRDPLVLPTCSSHSQTAEEAVSQYTAERATR